jgi:hypothetical protein
MVSWFESQQLWQPHPHLALPFVVPLASLLGLFHLLSTAFLGRCSMFLTTPTFWGLHCSLGFTLTHYPLRGCLQRLWPCHTLPSLSGLFSEILVEASITLFFLYCSCLQSQYHMAMPRFAVSLSSSLWVLGWINLGTHFLGSAVWGGCPKSPLSSRESL